MSRQRFGSFEFDSRRWLLFRKGRRQRVQEMPLKVLAMLLEHPGDIVSHDTFYRTLWPDDHAGLLEDNLYTVVRKLRQALRDSAHDPQYIETVPGRGYRFIAPVVPASEPARFGSWHRKLASSRVLALATGLVAVVVICAAWLIDHRQDRVWARQAAAAEIEQLNRDFRFIEAFTLADRALGLAPGVPEVEQLKRDASVPVHIRSEPSGATVYFRPYAHPAGEWSEIGITPLEEALLPRGHIHWRAEAAGHVSAEGSFATKWRRLFVELPPKEEAVEGMVWVPAGTVTVEGEPVRLDGYWIDRFEVTNREFARFVASGGYEDDTFWHEALDAGRLRWERVERDFRDRTGRPGPAGWRLGLPPEGEEDLPVTGINWYEAAAFCHFVGKSLPTLHHWRRAAGLGQEIYVDIRRAGNFSGQGPAPTGEHVGISRFGAYDMAGNVKEWTWNATGTQRHIAGGAWDEPEYMYHLPDARAPIERGETYGLRCASFTESLAAALLEPVEQTYHDFSVYEPVDDDVYEILERFYAYEPAPLNVRDKPVEHSVHWRRESVTFDAAYGGERMLAHLYIPEGVEPPYQTVIYVPGFNNVAPGPSDTPVDLALTDFVVRSGRVLVFPIFKHTYERYEPAWPPGIFSIRHQTVIEWYQDLARTLDYLDTREDIDSEAISLLAFSLGATMAPNFAALDDRLGPQIWLAGGLQRWTLNHPAETFPINFLPRVNVPVLKVAGRDDVLFGPPELSREPVIARLGTPEEHRRLVLLEGGHIPEWDEVIAESLDWLDRYLGPVTLSVRESRP
jgi:eukaryotic-like serine/threonine-protein kinase